MVCAVGNEEGNILDKIVIPTGMPDETMKHVFDWFRDKKIQSIGLACFGPLDLCRSSKTYGCIMDTPKEGWAYYNIVKTAEETLHIPVGFDTDVNGSMLGEAVFGAAKGKTDALYLTIGTGIGAGILSNGKLVHGMMHPEAGHILLNRVPRDTYQGKCRFHKNCFEGLASGPAIQDRWGKMAYELADRDDVWEMEADYIAQALTSYIFILSPQIIILGGGVMHQRQLLPLIREKVMKYINGYVKTDQLADMEHYIVAETLHDDQGILGALLLAVNALNK
jgi:fructokinase